MFFEMFSQHLRAAPFEKKISKNDKNSAFDANSFPKYCASFSDFCPLYYISTLVSNAIPLTIPTSPKVNVKGQNKVWFGM